MGGVTTYYPNPYYEVAGGTVKKYYYAGAQRVAMTDDLVTRNLLGDHLGSTAVTVAGTSELGEVRYKAFGATRFTSGTTPTTFRYTGQREEASFGLYYYGARWYDPALGRFVQADTIVPNAADAKAYDRYAYVLNNPLRYNDPSGHICVPVVNIGNTCSAPVNWDAVQASLDVAGMADPTPITDGSNAVISAVRGNWTDAGLSAVAMVPYLGDLAKGGKYADEAWAAGKTAWRWGKETLGLSDEAVAGFRSFTQGNFRENLSRLTGLRPDRVLEAHHVLPVKFEKDFGKVGINIHEPQFGSWVDATRHREWSNAYNQRWERFFRENEIPSLQQIEDFATQLAKEYGFDVQFRP